MYKIGVKTTFLFIREVIYEYRKLNFWSEVVCIIATRFVVQRLDAEFLKLEGEGAMPCLGM